MSEKPNGPLAGLRLVTTLPPHPWFGGIDYNFAVEMSEELRALEARTRETSAKAKPLFDKRGQILPRERVQRLGACHPEPQQTERCAAELARRSGTLGHMGNRDRRALRRRHRRPRTLRVGRYHRARQSQLLVAGLDDVGA